MASIPVEDRIASHTTIDGECIVWTAAKSRLGYGHMGVDGRTREVHRVAYEAFVGPVPEGLTLDHLCRNRACVNPDHLEPVPHRENVLRGEGPTAVNARKTHCKRGHELSPENVYINATSGSRQCRPCARLIERHR